MLSIAEVEAFVLRVGNDTVSFASNSFLYFPWIVFEQSLMSIKKYTKFWIDPCGTLCFVPTHYKNVLLLTFQCLPPHFGT